MPNLRGKTWTTSTPANVEDAQYWEDHLISDTAALKAASSVQSVNSITPDAQGNVDVVALPAGGTAGQVLTKQSSTAGDADWEDPASSGHTIEDEDGNIMPYQETLQFENAEVTNDSVNNKTIVDCKGSKGDAATITVGTVTTLPAGSDATVNNSGTSSDAVFDFGIPKGADGEGAVDSVNGYTGAVVLDASDVGALPDSTTIPTKTSELDNDSGFVTSSAIPTSLSELSDDTTHRLVTDAEKAAWDAKVSESLLKDTVGWVGKNELKVPSSVVTTTKNGATFTVTRNADGEVTEIDVDTSGNATSGIADLVIPTNLKAGSYIINGCPANGGDDTYRVDLRDYAGTGWTSAGVIITKGADVPFTLSADTGVSYYIRIGSGQTLSHKKFYPMFRDASVTDSTFEPYHESVEQCKFDREEQRVLGAKNIFTSPYESMSFAQNNVSFTVNSDLSITVTTNGLSATSNTAFVLWKKSECINRFSDYKGKKLTFSGGKNDVEFGVQSLETDGVGQYSNNNEVTVTVRDDLSNAGDNLTVKVLVRQGKTINNVTIYPMIRLASDPDDTYAQPAMTNRELTDAVTERELWTGTVDIEDGQDHELTLSDDQTSFKYLRLFFKSSTNVYSVVDFPAEYYNATRFGVTSNTVITNNNYIIPIRLTAQDDKNKIAVRAVNGAYQASSTFNVVKVVGIK